MHIKKGLYLYYVNLACSARQGNKSDTIKKNVFTKLKEANQIHLLFHCEIL